MAAGLGILRGRVVFKENSLSLVGACFVMLCSVLEKVATGTVLEKLTCRGLRVRVCLSLELSDAVGTLCAGFLMATLCWACTGGAEGACVSRAGAA